MIWIIGELIRSFLTTGRDACQKSTGISVLIQVKNFYGAIAVARPDLMWVIRDQNTVGPRCVGARLVTHKSRSYPENLILCHVYDIDTKVVSVGQIILLGYRVEPTDVLAPYGSRCWRQL